MKQVRFLAGLFLLGIIVGLVGCQLRPAAGPSATGDLARQPLQGSGPAIYLLSGGYLRHIADWATFEAWGYTGEDIVTVADERLARHPLGPQLTRWLVQPDEPDLYFLREGLRWPVPDLETMKAMGGQAADISLLPADLAARLPVAGEPLPALTRSQEARDHPRITAATWADGFLWTANETGLLTRWDTAAGTYQEYFLPGGTPVGALAGEGPDLYAGTETGGVWRLAAGETQFEPVAGLAGRISALGGDGQSRLWAATGNRFDTLEGQYRFGRGLVLLGAEGIIQELAEFGGRPPASDPLRYVTAIAVDPAGDALWVGTGFAGLLRYALETAAWQQFTTFNSGLADNRINDLHLAADGSLWLATPSGVSRYQDKTWSHQPLAEGVSDKGALALAGAGDGTVWVAGDHYLAWRTLAGAWRVHTGLHHSLLAEQFQYVVLDGADRPWFLGRRRKIHFDGQRWLAFGVDVRRSTEFTLTAAPPADVAPPPREFPDPTQDYGAWLQTWPRPDPDNGRGMHFVQRHWLDEIEAQQQINRLKRLGVRWTLVNYANHYQLRRLAPLFAEAGITVVWRPFVRPYESYEHWTDDVEFLRERGWAPYFQLYNEPSLAQEWEDDRPIDQEIFLRHLLPAVREVYEAGGYAGLQFIDPDWLRLTLQTMKTEGLADTFDRLFFVPHPYGLNHPPAYDEDRNGVLGFQEFAGIFEAEIGFVPVMIAGEGGWRPGEAQDNRYPAVSETMHRDYHREVFDWFRTGRLSNGEPLPDYLFAFCPWLISDPHDPAAWFDSAGGNRILTIEAVEAMPEFRRRFSWDKCYCR